MCFNLADGPRCRICADERRDPELICVVEEPSDVISIERTHEFGGRYHVLGGALSPIDGIDPEDLKIAELSTAAATATVREVVVATNPTTTGEATALHIAAELRASSRPSSRSPGWPAGCRSGPTSSTPTSSRSAGRWPAAAPSSVSREQPVARLERQVAQERRVRSRSRDGRSEHRGGYDVGDVGADRRLAARRRRQVGQSSSAARRAVRTLPSAAAERR